MKKRIVCIIASVFTALSCITVNASAAVNVYSESFEYSTNSELLNVWTLEGRGTLSSDSGGVSGKALKITTESGKEASTIGNITLPSDSTKFTLEMYLKADYYFTLSIVKSDDSAVKLIGTNSTYKTKLGYYKTNMSRLSVYTDTYAGVSDGLADWNLIKLELDTAKNRCRVIMERGEFTVADTEATEALSSMKGIMLSSSAESGKVNTLLADEIKVYETTEKNAGISMAFQAGNCITQNVESAELTTNTNIENLGVIIDFGDTNSVDYMLIGALYNDGALQNAVIRDGNYIKATDTEVIYKNLDLKGSAKNFDTLKFFLVEKDTFNPICNAAAPRKAYGDTTSAEAYLGSICTLNGFKSVEMGMNTTSNASEVDGESCWIIDKNSGTDGCYMNFTLEDYMKPTEFDGSRYTVKVDYFDAEDGKFRLCYRDRDGEFVTADTIYTSGENVWKTAEINLDDAVLDGNCYDQKFGNSSGKGKCDFLIQTRFRSSDQNYSSVSIAIKRVAVYRNTDIHSVYVYAKSGEPGASYKWFENEKIMPITVENFTNKAEEVVLTSKIIDSTDTVVLSNISIVDVGGNEKETVDVDFGEIKKCDIYTYKVDAEISNGQSYTSETKFAVLKTDPDGIRNDEVYFAGHAERYTDESAEEYFNMLELSNSGGYRGEFQWQGTVDSGFNLLTEQKIDSTVYGRTKRLIKNHNFGYIALLCCPPQNGLFSSWKDLPKTTAQINQWKGFIGMAADYLQDVTYRYELLNEPNISAFNSDLTSFWGAEYATLAKATKEEIANHDSDALVGGPAVTGIEVDDENSVAKGWNFYKAGIDAGMGDGIDALALHPYPNGDGPYEGAKSTRVVDLTRYKEEYVTATDGKIPELWHTESGYSAGAMTEKNRGRLNIGMLTTLKFNKLADITALYSFDSTGEVGREDKYGHVYGGYEDSKKFGFNYFPKESYLMITAYNYVMANSEPTENCDPTGTSNTYSNGQIVRARRFKSGKFNNKSTGEYKDILVVWTSNGGSYNITLDLGTKSVTHYDEYGNEETLTSGDGVYTVATGIYPTYFVGNFKNCTVTK